MAVADDVATIAELRDHLSLATGEEDGKLEGMRAAVIAVMESMTRRNILDRSVTAEADGCSGDDLVFNVADAVVSATQQLDYRRASDGPGFGLTANVSVDSDQILVKDDCVVMRPTSDGWPDREPDTRYAATFTTGMTDVPAQMQEAAKLMVREIYEGSAMDEVTMRGLVQFLLGKWLCGRVVAPGVNQAADRAVF